MASKPAAILDPVTTETASAISKDLHLSTVQMGLVFPASALLTPPAKFRAAGCPIVSARGSY